MDLTSTTPPAPVAAVGPPPRPVRVFAHGKQACVALDDGGLQCWGPNTVGELGAGHTRDTYAPQRVVGLRDVARLVLEWSRACAITSAGTLHCWGESMPGMPASSVPRPVTLPSDAVVRDVALGYRHACAIDAAGALHCWGSNDQGQLGLGPGAAREVAAPTRVEGLPPMEGVVIAGSRTAAWSRAGDLFLWGADGFGWRFDAPHRVQLASGVARVAMAFGQLCVLRRDREVRCLDETTLAAFERGRQHDYGPKVRALVAAGTSRRGPLRGVSPTGGLLYADGRGLRDVVDLIVFDQDASALTASGQVYSWGDAEHGTIAHWSETRGSLPPTPIPGATGITAITGGFTHRCVLDEAGAVSCFGHGAPTFDRSGDADPLRPRRVAGLPEIVAMASNDTCTYAIGVDDKVYAWGEWAHHACGLDEWEDLLHHPIIVRLAR